MNRPLARVSTPQLTWALLDGAREPFFSIVLSIVFPPYFVATIAADPVTGTAQWGYMLATSAVILVILAPVAGVVVNASERPRTWIAALVLIAAFSLLGLWPGTHGKSTPDTSARALRHRLCVD